MKYLFLKYYEITQIIMAKFIEKWSVASVFNEWGMARFEDAYDCGFCAQLLCQTFGRVSQVAEYIGELGYDVEIERSFLTGLFIIKNISKTDDNGTCINYYGSNGTETELDWKANLLCLSAEIEQLIIKLFKKMTARVCSFVISTTRRHLGI